MPSWDHWMCCVERSYPPPHVWPLWYVGRAINTECCGIIPQYCTRCCLHSVWWHTGSHCIIISNFISLFLLFLRKKNLFVWLPRVVLNSSLQRLWSLLMRSSLPPGHHQNHLNWVDSSPWWLTLSYDSFQCFLPLLTRSSLPFECPENHLIWVDSIWTVPLGFL
jgi:hypothetical protein